LKYIIDELLPFINCAANECTSSEVLHSINCQRRYSFVFLSGNQRSITRKDKTVKRVWWCSPKGQ